MGDFCVRRMTHLASATLGCDAFSVESEREEKKKTKKNHKHSAWLSRSPIVDHLDFNYFHFLSLNSYLKATRQEIKLDLIYCL